MRGPSQLLGNLAIQFVGGFLIQNSEEALMFCGFTSCEVTFASREAATPVARLCSLVVERWSQSSQLKGSIRVFRKVQGYEVASRLCSVLISSEASHINCEADSPFRREESFTVLMCPHNLLYEVLYLISLSVNPDGSSL